MLMVEMLAQLNSELNILAVVLYSETSFHLPFNHFAHIASSYKLALFEKANNFPLAGVWNCTRKEKPHQSCIPGDAQIKICFKAN
jgi:hypothetical protein